MATEVKDVVARLLGGIGSTFDDELTLSGDEARSIASLLESLSSQVEAYLPFPGDDEGEFSGKSYWDATIGAFYDDKTWHPNIWGKHRALHYSSVRQALAICQQRAPEAADVIATLVWSRELDRARTEYLVGDATERATAAEGRVALLEEALDLASNKFGFVAALTDPLNVRAFALGAKKFCDEAIARARLAKGGQGE